ncbi:MAG: HU family DNA-binding protein [Crocinitomicaceae bacterium]
MANYIAETEGIDRQDAINTIAKFIREIQSNLNKGDSFDIFEFGSFKKNAAGEIEFNSWNNPNLDNVDFEKTENASEVKSDSLVVENSIDAEVEDTIQEEPISENSTVDEILPQEIMLQETWLTEEDLVNPEETRIIEQDFASEPKNQPEPILKSQDEEGKAIQHMDSIALIQALLNGDSLQEESSPVEKIEQKKTPIKVVEEKPSNPPTLEVESQILEDETSKEEETLPEQKGESPLETPIEILPAKKKKRKLLWLLVLLVFLSVVAFLGWYNFDLYKKYLPFQTTSQPKNSAKEVLKKTDNLDSSVVNTTFNSEKHPVTPSTQSLDAKKNESTVVLESSKNVKKKFRPTHLQLIKQNQTLG